MKKRNSFFCKKISHQIQTFWTPNMTFFKTKSLWMFFIDLLNFLNHYFCIPTLMRFYLFIILNSKPFYNIYKMLGTNLFSEDLQSINLPLNLSPSNSLQPQSCSLLKDKDNFDNTQKNIIWNPTDPEKPLLSIKDGQINFYNNQTSYFNNDQTILNESPHVICDPGQGNLTNNADSMISKFISISQENHENQLEPTSHQMNSQNNFMDSQNWEEEIEEVNTQPSPQNSNKSQSRANDSNNAHKKMNTCLNKASSHPDIKRLQSLINKQEAKNNVKLEFVKSSRYGFIQKLLLLRHFFGNQYIAKLYLKFGVQLQKFVKKLENHKSSQAKTYLLNLPDFYMNAFNQFIQGSVDSAVETLYMMEDNFKQKTYMIQGKKKVMSLKRKLDDLTE